MMLNIARVDSRSRRSDSRVVRALLSVLIIGAFTACPGQEPPRYEPRYGPSPRHLTTRPLYVFGVHPLHNVRRLTAVYQPMVDFLNRGLGDVELTLEASSSYAAFDEKLRTRQLAFALPNPYQTVQAAAHGYRIFAKVRNDEDFRGILLVRKDSGITTLEQLRGKSISYPAPTALAATMLPQWLLHQNGLQAGRDVESRYVGSQESSIMNVYLGQTAAAATWPSPWRALARERPEVGDALVVRWQTPTLPNNGLIARDDVPEALVARVRALFVDLDRTPEGRALLAAAEIEGFEPATEATYAPVREFVGRFEAEVRKAGDP